jgi:hypothetical protein
MISQSLNQPVFTVERYSNRRKSEWDNFVRTAKNATFLFCRDYMDYHRDRFADFSLLVYRDQELVAVLPANLDAEGALVSHEGLTYGGLVVPRTAKLAEVLASFYAVLRSLNELQIPRLKYKRIPGFYNTLPDDEVNYALFLLEAQLYRRDCAAAVVLADRLPLRKGHHSAAVRAQKQGVRIVQDPSFQPFWEKVLTPRLDGRYGVKPVHTLEEISLLAARFPDQIKQFSAYQGEEILAGVTVYETPTVAHAQYSAATEKGRQLGAQTYLASALIEHYQHKQVFDFGISNENGGRILNHGLQDWKEGFGARCFAHDFYEVATANFTQLERIIGPTRVVLAQPEAVPEAVAGYEEKQPDLAECPVVAKGAQPVGLRARIRNWICYATGISVDEMFAQTGSMVVQAACCL